MIRQFVPPLSLAGLLPPPAPASDFATDQASNWHHWRGANVDGTAPPMA